VRLAVVSSRQLRRLIERAARLEEEPLFVAEFGHETRPALAERLAVDAGGGRVCATGAST
jgi:hypothetical protein